MRTREKKGHKKLVVSCSLVPLLDAKYHSDLGANDDVGIPMVSSVFFGL
jgi:hypothetical protein